MQLLSPRATEATSTPTRWATANARTRSWLVVAAAFVTTMLGCRRDGATTELPPRTVAPAAVPVPTAADEGHGKRHAAQREVSVRVDGEHVAVLTYGELPPGMRLSRAPDDATPRYFRLADYLRGLGVDLRRVRAVHVGGNRSRVASVEGGELRADEARFVFDFTQGVTGAPAVMWSTAGLTNPKHIDFMRSLDVYVAKAPPALDTNAGCYAAPDGGCAATEAAAAPRGVRVYVDGHLEARLKRRDLGDAATAATTGVPLFTALKAAGVPLAAVQRVDLVSGDDLVGHGAASVLKGIRLTAPAHAHSTLAADLPTAVRDGAAPHEHVPVTAIQLYARTTPPRRALASLGDGVGDGNVALAGNTPTEASGEPR